jgi:nicotinic acid phosphoribosyltransferase
MSVLKDSEGNYCLHDKQENIADSGELLTVFRNGSLVRETTLSEIRTR